MRILGGAVWLIAGVVLGLVAGLLFGRWVITHPSMVNLEVVGASVTAAGGATVRISSRGGELVQTCRGPCDDVRLRMNPMGEKYDVAVQTADRRCVLCTLRYTGQWPLMIDTLGGAPLGLRELAVPQD